MNSYHNTANETDRLEEYEQKAATQEQRVLDFFRRWHSTGFTPSQICGHVLHNRAPITSARRAMTNLTQAGKLVMTNETRWGKFGRKEHVWRLAEQPRQGKLI